MAKILTLEKNKVLALTPSELEAYFVSLKAYLGKIPRVALTLAFTPSTEFIAVIGDWLSKNLGKKNILFLGRINNYDDIIREIKKASILALPSKRENFGIVPLEAMACETAVVSSDTEGPRDYIQNGSNGLMGGCFN